MNLSRNAVALGLLLVASLVLVTLLSPMGFEDRPQTALKIGGYLAIATIFAAFVLDVAALVLLYRRSRWAPKLAIAGSILLFVPIVGDQLGAFFSVPIPPVINTLEYVLVVVLLGTLFVAWRLNAERTTA
jgi:hypothetical protein